MHHSDDNPLAAELGEVIGGYRLESIIGRGGMGTVFLGSHTLLGRTAAVKVLSADLASDRDYVARFFQEARVASEARHANVVDIVDYVATDEPRRVAIVMEHIEGPTLSKVLRRQRLDVVQACHLGLQLASALEAVHRVGVVHRDLKPDNLLITGDLDDDLSAVPSVKVLDFGIAKAIDRLSAAQTMEGMLLGTPAYMAPEQITGLKVSPATDVYAMGELLYEMVTGEHLFSGTKMEILEAKVSPTPPSIELPADLPGSALLATLIYKCVQPSESNRPTTRQLQDLLQKVLFRVAGIAALTPPTPGAAEMAAFAERPLSEAPTSSPGTFWKVAWAALATSLVLAAFAAGLLFGDDRPSPFEEGGESPVKITPLEVSAARAVGDNRHAGGPAGDRSAHAANADRAAPSATNRNEDPSDNAANTNRNED